MAFENRAEAGQMLARRLAKYRGQRPMVLAIPRGAVPMGKIVADVLDGELDVLHHFRDFSQVSDDDVVATLQEARRPRREEAVLGRKA